MRRDFRVSGCCTDCSGWRIEAQVPSRHSPAAQFESILPLNVGGFLQRHLEVAHTNPLAFVLAVDAVAMFQVEVAQRRLGLAKVAYGLQSSVGQHGDQLRLLVGHAAAGEVRQTRLGFVQHFALAIDLVLTRIALDSATGQRADGQTCRLRSTKSMAVSELLSTASDFDRPDRISKASARYSIDQIEPRVER